MTRQCQIITAQHARRADSAIRAKSAKVNCAPAPRAAIYLRPYVLLALLAGALAVSLLMTNNLFDHLRASAYTNLFTNLVWWRFALYFGLGVECLAWYYATLNDIREQLSSIRQPGTPVASPSEIAAA